MTSAAILHPAAHNFIINNYANDITPTTIVWVAKKFAYGDRAEEAFIIGGLCRAFRVPQFARGYNGWPA